QVVREDAASRDDPGRPPPPSHRARPDVPPARPRSSGAPPARVARPVRPALQRSALMKTALCDLLGIEVPIVGFTPSPKVAVAISRAGGLGVLGAVRYGRAEELDEALSYIDANVGGRPY